MDNDIKVINLSERSFVFKPSENKEIKSCYHESGILVCEETRTVECKKCGIVLDPFEYLRKMAYQDETAFTRHHNLLLENERLAKRYTNLNKEIQRLNKVKSNLKNP